MLIEQTFISQQPHLVRAEHSAVTQVRASASVEASRLVFLITTGCYVEFHDGNPVLVIPEGNRFLLARELERIADNGLLNDREITPATEDAE